MIAEMRRRCGGKVLPYDAEIEYLESTGTQWIDTGVMPLNWHPNVEVLVKKTNANAIVCLYTSAKSWAWASESIAFNGKELYLMQISSHPYNDVENNKKYLLKLNNTLVELFKEGELCYSGSITRVASTATVKFLGDFNSHYYQIYYAKVSNGNNLVFDAIPVRVGQVGYMYDKVSGQLFGNQGTGDFILGPDKIGGGKHLILNMLHTSVERRCAA